MKTLNIGSGKYKDNNGEWSTLPCLKGDKGEQGVQGIQGIKGNVGEKGDKGDTGESAYQLAVRLGTFTGTEEEYNKQITDAVDKADTATKLVKKVEDQIQKNATEIDSLKKDLGGLEQVTIKQTERYTDYEWIKIPIEQSTGRILVGWNSVTYPDGCWLNKGADSYSYKKFECDGVDKFKIEYSTVQNRVANYAFYDENEKIISIYPTSAIGKESSILDYEVEVPSKAKWFYVITRTSSISMYGFKVYKSAKNILTTFNFETVQQTVDSMFDAESTGIENIHVVTDESKQKKVISSRNEYKYPKYSFFGGEYLEHWYEKIYDGTQSVVIDIEGDSISQGYTGQNCFLGMRDNALKKIMKSGGYDLKKISIFNNAIGGCSTNEWVGRTEYFKNSFKNEEYYIKYVNGMIHYGMEHNPDLMIVGFGMNDANIATNELNLKQRLDLFESNFREALQRIRGSEQVNGREAYNKDVNSLSIIITTITNTHGYEERKLSNWHIYANEIMKKLCRDYMCAYADFTTSTYGYTDKFDIYSQVDTNGNRIALHPNKYQMMYLMSTMKDLVYPIALHNIDVT